MRLKSSRAAPCEKWCYIYVCHLVAREMSSRARQPLPPITDDQLVKVLSPFAKQRARKMTNEDIANMLVVLEIVSSFAKGSLHDVVRAQYAALQDKRAYAPPSESSEKSYDAFASQRFMREVALYLAMVGQENLQNPSKRPRDAAE